MANIKLGVYDENGNHISIPYEYVSDESLWFIENELGHNIAITRIENGYNFFLLYSSSSANEYNSGKNRIFNFLYGHVIVINEYSETIAFLNKLASLNTSEYTTIAAI